MDSKKTKRGKWFTVAPLVAVLRAWARRLERSSDDLTDEVPIELNGEGEEPVEGRELWPPAG